MTISSFAGIPYGSAAQSAKVYLPRGVAVDSAGIVYVADSGNHAIRKITPDGTLTTLAGSPGNPGSDDGIGSAARFFYPSGVAVDGAGIVYIADTYNLTIRRITPLGVVTTMAGLAGESIGGNGNADGTGSAARFGRVEGVAVDGAGNVYVADGQFGVRKITPGGVVTTLAGAPSRFGTEDGTGSAARFGLNGPAGLAVDAAGNVYVADISNSTIRKVTAAGVVTTLAGATGSRGIVDGTSGTARFVQPKGVAVDAAGTVYVADLASTVRKISASGVVTTVAGVRGSPDLLDGTLAAARFSQPNGVAVDRAGNIYVADADTNSIRKISSTGTVTTLALGAPRFPNAHGLALDPAGNLYFADTNNNTIRKVTPGGLVVTLVGNAAAGMMSGPGGSTVLGGNGGNFDGDNLAAKLNSPEGVAVDSAGIVYVSDTQNHNIKKVTPAGVVTTLAGISNTYAVERGSADGIGSGARFNFPKGLAVDRSGNVYVADSFNRTVRKITPAGVVTTLAGKVGSSGSNDGVGSAARFKQPQGVAVDVEGNIYVTDTADGFDPGNNTIRKISPDGVVTTLVGSVGKRDDVDGVGSAAVFSIPNSLAIDASGNLYVSESFTVRYVTISGMVSTIAGGAFFRGSEDGPGRVARFSDIQGIALDGGGVMYLLDSLNGTIRLGMPATEAPIIMKQPLSQVVAAGQSATFAVTASSSAPLTYQWRFNGTAISGATGPSYTLANVQGAAAGSYAVAVTNRGGSVVSAAATLIITAANYGGAYFGAFGGGVGTWALYVRPDLTGLLIAYLGQVKTSFAANVTVKPDGSFNAIGSTVASAPDVRNSVANEIHRLAAAPQTFTIEGQIGLSGQITGQLGGAASAGMSGAADITTSTISSSSGVYTAAVLNSANGFAYAVVSASGRTFVVTANALGADSAVGTVNSNGQLTAATASGGQLSFAVNAQTQTVAATLTPSGSTTAVSFSGLAEGVLSTSRVIDISVLTSLAAGGDTFTLGYVIGGDGTNGPKPLVIRAAGPSLAAFGVPGVLADPKIELFTGATKTGENDDWGGGAAISGAMAGVGAFAYASSASRDAATAVSITSHDNSVRISASDNGTGAVIAEIYDATPAASLAPITPRLINVSVLKNIGTGLTAGFVIGGIGPKTVLVRAIGPTLGNAPFNVAGVVADPQLTLFSAQAPIGENNDWGTPAGAGAATATQLSAAFARVGAFALTAGSRDAALLATLAPGNYTVQVTGVNTSAGVALIEIYEVP